MLKLSSFFRVLANLAVLSYKPLSYKKTCISHPRYPDQFYFLLFKYQIARKEKYDTGDEDVYFGHLLKFYFIQENREGNDIVYRKLLKLLYSKTKAKTDAYSNIFVAFQKKGYLSLNFRISILVAQMANCEQNFS